MPAFLILLFISCAVEPVDIEYHEDQCHACRMTIADSRFGAELVTLKGKVYKFDALECLVPELKEKGEATYKFVLATDFDLPKTFLDARTATFLISKNLPSPMGGNLSTYASETAAKAALEKHSGKLYSWEELKAYDGFWK